MAEDIVVAARARAQSMREGTGAAVTRTPSTHVMLENLAAEIERLRAQLRTLHDSYDIVRAGEMEAREQLEALRASLSRAEEALCTAVGAAWLAGFDASGEGWNSEYPPPNEAWRQARVAAYLAEQGIGIAGGGSLEEPKP